MPINISISASDVAEIRQALRQLLGDDQPAPATLATAIAEAVEVAEAPAGERLLDAAREMRASLAPEVKAPAQAPAAAPAAKRGRPPRRKGPEASEAVPEAEVEVAAEYEDELADELPPVGLEAAKQTVKDALNGYLTLYGMEAAQEDVLRLYGMIFKDGSVTKLSDIPEGMHSRVADGVREMTSKNPFKRKPV